MKQRILPLLLVLASVGAYAGLLSRSDLEFVYDDHRFVMDNQAIRDMGNFAEFFANPATADSQSWSGIYRPLRTLDFAIDYAIVGTTEGAGAVRWYHFRNVIYHALATLLVFWLFLRWGADRNWAGLGALVFALHPVQVEAVAWVTSRADVLCLVLLLGAMLLHARSRGLDRFFAGAAGLLVLALLAKEASIVFPGLVLLTDFVFRDERKLRTTLKRWPSYLIYSAIVGVYILLWINRHDVHGGSRWEVEPLIREVFPGQLLTMARGFAYYLRLLILPVDLAQDYYVPEVTSLDVLTVICALFVLGAIAWSCLAIFRVGSIFAFAVLWFLIAIFPTSNLLVPIGIPTAERFLYLPMVGVAFLCGSLLARVVNRGAFGRVVVGALFVCLFAVSFTRAQVWTSNRALWSSTLRYESPRAVEWFAAEYRTDGEELQARERELRDQGKFEEANLVRDEAHALLERSVAEHNRAILAWKRLAGQVEKQFGAQARQAISLFDLGRFDDALERADECVSLYPGMADARYARSLALAGLGRLRESAAELERTLLIRSSKNYLISGAGIYEKLAEYYERRENQARAYLALQRSFDLMPSEADNPAVFRALRNLEAAYRSQVSGLEAAIAKKPADGDRRLQLASVHASFGNYQVAGAMFDDLMRPDQVGRHPLVLGPYALYFWQWRDTKDGYERAIAIYREILAADPGRADIREQIDVCLKELAELPKENQ